MRLTLLCCALVCAFLSGCEKAEDGKDGGVGVLSLFDPAGVNPSLCGAPAIPFPNNALFADATSPTGVTRDTTLNIPSAASTAVAANLTDGFSTSASIFTDVLGSVDYSTASNAIVILEADATPRILVPGVDYTIQPSIAMSQVSGTGGCALDPTVNTGAAKFQPISGQRSRLLIEPLKPLNASTTYIVAVTTALKSRDGIAARPNEFFQIVNSDTKLCKLGSTGSDAAGTELACSDANAPADAAARTGQIVLNFMRPAASCATCTSANTRLATLESLRRNLVRPTVTAFKGLTNSLRDPDITDDDLMIAWSFTTQSISATLATVNAIATAKTFGVINAPGPGGTLSTGELGVGLADSAEIFVGSLVAVPYYLDDAASTTDSASQGGFWLNDGTITTGATAFVPFTPPADYDGNPGTPVTPAPCSGAPFQFQATPPVSTTNCHRIPLQRSTEDLPVMITVPKTARPTNGWPVVIFQHGITGNRTQMLPIGAALAAAGFVTVSIDLPLHGVLPGGSFYAGAGAERTFDLDIVNNTSSAPPGGDGTDPSGTHFINLSSLITSRDNLRQAVADLSHVTKSLQAANPVNLDGDAGTDDIDQTRIYFAGISLGGIVGTTFLGVNTDVRAASLHVPGGALGKLLDASASFGPRIAAGLAGVAFGANLSGVSSPFEGTDTYETFVRFAQHLVDPGDPINYAVAANALHRIHMTEVIGDTVVPNTANSTCPSVIPPSLGATATSNGVAETRLAACLAGAALVGSNGTTAAACTGIGSITPLCPGNASQDETILTGYLSGTEPLFETMGLEVIGPITPPGSSSNRSDTTNGLDVVVQFAIGTHGSLLTPAGPAGATQFLAVTCEMQRQTASFLASDGTSLSVGGSCP